MTGFNRRLFLKSLGLGALGAGMGTSLPQTAEGGAFFFKRMFAVPPRETYTITPNEKFYIVNYADFPTVDLASWSLYIGGSVKKPLRLTFADFLSRPSIEMASTLICIDTLPGADTVGTAVWRGTPLKKILEEVEPEDTAFDVIFRGADGYSDSIPFEKAMSDDVLLVYKMNGETLTKAHGFPIRAIVPGLFGIKNVKWITEIEVVETDYKGYWQQRGWTDEGHVRTISRINTPGHYQEVQNGRHLIKGIAFSGIRGIRKVELSFDGGGTWTSTHLDPPLSPYTWVIWNYDWKPEKRGAYTLAVRAWDGEGNVQEAANERAYPRGASGYHTVIALVP